MVTLTETLNRINNLLWKPLHIDVIAIEASYKDYEEKEMRLHDAFIFDIRKASEENLMDLIEDPFGDGVPEDLDFEKKIPFALVGGRAIDKEFRDESKEGNFNILEQPHYMLFLDLENGTGEKVPVYKIDIDGTANPDSLMKIADDVTKLKFIPGFVNSDSQEIIASKNIIKRYTLEAAQKLKNFNLPFIFEQRE